MNNIRIENPWLLFIALPLVVIMVIGFFILPKGKRKKGKNIASFCLHLMMSITLALAFSDIQILHTNQSTEVYVLADCSASNKSKIDQLDSLIDDAIKKAGNEPNSDVGVIAFGKDAKTIVEPGKRFKTVEDVFEDEDFISATDLEKALTYAQSEFTEDAIKRIIIISDGEETDGDALSTVESLISDGINIDAVSLDNDISDEVAITALDYNDHCFVGREETVKASIRTKKSQNVRVEITSEGKTLKNEPVELNRGINIVSFELENDRVGEFDYTITITNSDGDTFSENNSMSFTQDYTDEMNVLLLTKSSTDESVLKSLDTYNSDKVTIKTYVDSYNVPYKIEDLIQYDEIILSDFNLTDINHAEEFSNNLNAAVNKYGKTVMTFGSTDTESEEPYIEYYNDMLPVQFQTDSQKAVVFLIDSSGSMMGGLLDTAKRGTIACLDSLNESDYVSIIAFESDVHVVQSMTSMKNKAQIIKSINSIQDGGSTAMYAGMQKAYEQFNNMNIGYKTVITLTDGLPSDSESKLKSLVYRMGSEGIVCSFINIANRSGESLLSDLARRGNGFYRYCTSAASLVNVMVAAMTNEIADKKVEKTTDIMVNQADDPVLAGVGTLPSIGGYNFCHVKTAANTVLTVQYISEEDEDGNTSSAIVPLYAYWNYGRGKVSSFTSSLSGSWTSQLRSNAYGKLLLANMAKEMLPSRAISSSIDVNYENKGAASVVTINAHDGDKAAAVSLTVTSPNGDKADYVALYNGEDYEVAIAIEENGKYNLHIVYKSTQTDAEDDFPLYFDYSKEYDAFQNTSNTLLSDITRKSKGDIGYNEVVYNVSTEQIAISSYTSTMLFFILLTIILFLIDIVIRKTDFKKKKKASAEND